MARLTDVSIRSLPLPATGQKIYFDDAVPNFGLRVSQGGTRSFVLQYGASRQLTTIGRHGVISLADARAEARRILAEHTLGRHRPQSVTWDEAKAQFLAFCEAKNKPRTVRDYKRLLNRHFSFGRTKLGDITPQDINRRIDRLHRAVSEQNHALVSVKIFFRWAQRRHYVQHSPCEGMQTVKRQSRDRVLDMAELRSVYFAAEQHGYPFGNIVLLCILTGQRRSEIAWLKRSYIQGDICTLPASLTKNKREHSFPLGSLAATLIKRMPNTGDYLFPAERGDTVFGGWSKCKTALDKLCDIEPWVLHDLRRTFATIHAAIGTPPHITEKLLNHVSGTISGVAAIYNRHAYLDEMRKATKAYEAHISKVLRSYEKQRAS